MQSFTHPKGTAPRFALRPLHMQSSTWLLKGYNIAVSSSFITHAIFHSVKGQTGIARSVIPLVAYGHRVWCAPSPTLLVPDAAPTPSKPHCLLDRAPCPARATFAPPCSQLREGVATAAHRLSASPSLCCWQTAPGLQLAPSLLHPTCSRATMLPR